MLNNHNNYGIYVEIAYNKQITIYTKDITLDNWESHYSAIFSILKDAIETEYVQKYFIHIVFTDNEEAYLSLPDYFINIILWKGVLKVGNKLESKYIYFDENITSKGIKSYIDTHIVIPYTRIINNKELNNIIDDMIYPIVNINDFSFYLANTINLEDDIKLMNENPEVYDLLHMDFTGISLEDIKTYEMEKVYKLINIIKNTEGHCLLDFFKSGEGINPKQYKEYALNIGIKPDGEGGVYPIVINNSFIRGGLSDMSSMFVEARAGRTAQILSKENVGDSGYFARLLGLNNSDTLLHEDPNYVCDSKNFEEIIIENPIMLSMLNLRYYRLHPNGMEYMMTKKDSHLIGQKIYLRSPMTCASKSRGDGICYRCYGDLAYTNCNINIGKLAAELLSSILTQMLLSAKHLLDSLVEKIEWSKGYDKFFTLDMNIIYLQDGLELNGYKLIINPDLIDSESEYDDFEYNQFVNEFDVVNKQGKVYKIMSKDGDNMYITPELNARIQKLKLTIDDKIVLSLNSLVEMPLFVIQISNNELSKTLESIKRIINNNAVTSKFDRNSILQAMLSTMIEGGITINAVHAETIISNQLRHVDDILREPDWSIPGTPYSLITLNHALKSHPSLIVTLSYERLMKTLYTPLTFSKNRNRPSMMDPFFTIKPQVYLDDKTEGVIK